MLKFQLLRCPRSSFLTARFCSSVYNFVDLDQACIAPYSGGFIPPSSFSLAEAPQSALIKR